jgi:hypothetical protein
MSCQQGYPLLCTTNLDNHVQKTIELIYSTSSVTRVLARAETSESSRTAHTVNAGRAKTIAVLSTKFGMWSARQEQGQL